MWVRKGLFAFSAAQAFLSEPHGTGSPSLMHYREPAGTKEVGKVEELMQNRKYMQSLHQEGTIFIQHLSEGFNTLQGCWPHTPRVVTVQKKPSATV